MTTTQARKSKLRRKFEFSLRPSAYLCGLCVEIAHLTQRTQRYAEDRREEEFEHKFTEETLS